MSGARLLQPPRTWKRLLISWEMTKEAIWRILIRTVNLCFINIPLVPHGGEGRYRARIGRREIRRFLQCSRPEIMESLKRNAFFLNKTQPQAIVIITVKIV